PHQVDGVRAAERLGQNIADPGRLDHGPDRAARDHSRARCRGLEQDLGGAEVLNDEVWDRIVTERNLDQRLLGDLGPFADGVRYFVRLAEAGADVTLAIADDHQRAEAEAPTALHHLRHAIDPDHLLFEGETGRINSWHVTFSYLSAA